MPASISQLSHPPNAGEAYAIAFLVLVPVRLPLFSFHVPFRYVQFKSSCASSKSSQKRHAGLIVSDIATNLVHAAVSVMSTTKLKVPNSVVLPEISPSGEIVIPLGSAPESSVNV